MPRAAEFNPDWASAPGETISDILGERGLSLADLGSLTGYEVSLVQGLLAGRTAITPEIAQTLQLALGSPAKFWLNREAQYRDDLARRTSRERASLEGAWLAELPLADMLRFGWVKRVASPQGQIAECLRFFGVPDVGSWRSTYQGVLQQVAYRHSPTFPSDPPAVAAWLRQGELQTMEADCAPWNPSSFRDALKEARRLTRKRKPADFLPVLRALCAQTGVSVVILRAPSKCRASGATRFLSNELALLQLSFRYLTEDHFWFTFFHEAGHLLLHGKENLFLEGSGFSDSQEDEANSFAASILIPHDFQSAFQRLQAERHEIRHFAKDVGISPGIVVGQLQHLGRARRNQLNNLKARFSWRAKGGA